jgi:dihydropteroate synthase
VDIAISVDTRNLSVMQAALQAGACIVNDVNALRSEGAREWAAAQGVGVCLMHMRGEPRTMQSDPHYVDVVAEVAEFLASERARCIDAGIAADAIVLDPGIGFGKRHEHNMTLLKKLKCLTTLGSPLLIGVSRKSLIGKVLGGESNQRLYGGLGLAALAVSMGAKIIRTHDVAATREAVTMVGAVLN